MLAFFEILHSSRTEMGSMGEIVEVVSNHRAIYRNFFQLEACSESSSNLFKPFELNLKMPFLDISFRKECEVQ